MKLSVITPTHDTTWLSEAWESLRLQTHTDFEWVVSVNHATGDKAKVEELEASVRQIVGADPRVVIVQDLSPFAGVGARKKFAFSLGTGEGLVELDHDDLLLPNALEEIAKAFEDSTVGFCYSDFADFDSGNLTEQGTWTYRTPEVRAGWGASGSTFYDVDVAAPRPMKYEFVRAQKVTANLISTIYQAPNHVRAWRRLVYHQVGGHNPAYRVCDDHELMLRTYLVTRMRHIEAPLYLYRVSGNNTWAKNIPEIQRLTYELRDEYLHRLVLRECELLGLPAYDLGGALDTAPGWKSVDIDDKEDGTPPDVKADLTQRWPFEDNSVGAFRAFDFLEHLPDRLHTLREIHRCLRPGGWLLSFTPSTDGRAAWQDPTHVSFWNKNSWWYHLKGYAQTKYVRRNNPIFNEVRLIDHYPSDWHRNNAMAYVTADMTAWKPEAAKTDTASQLIAPLRPRLPIVFYTALYGEQTDLKEFDTGGYKFVCFTDDANLKSNTWDIRVVERKENTPRMRAKWFKLFPPKEVREAGIASVWIDASVKVTDVQKMAETCLQALNGHDVALFKHPERDNVVAEAMASAKLPKYANERQQIMGQAESYTALGLPAALYAGGVIVRWTRNRAVERQFELTWWEEINMHSSQDQISLPYVLWKKDITPGVIPGSVYGTDFHQHIWAGPDK